MKRLFSLFLTAILLLSLSTAQAYQKQHQLHLDIEFDRNIIMARYDVDVLINGEKTAQLPHGGHLVISRIVPEGLCSITIEKVGHPDVCVTIIVGVTANTRVEGKIHANRSDLEFLSLTTNCPESAYRFSEGDALNLDGIQLRIAGHRSVTAYNGHRPSSGKTYLVCQVEFTNNRSGDIAVAALLSASAFDACCDDYEIDADWYAMYGLSEESTIESIFSLLKGLTTTSEVIHPGKKVSFDLVYEVPTNWKTLEIYYYNSLLVGDEAVIVVRNK